MLEVTLKRDPQAPAFYYEPREGLLGKTTFEDGAINFKMVFHNAHQRAKSERAKEIAICAKYGETPRSYRELFAAELRDQMREAHSMSAWKRGRGWVLTEDYLASVRTDGAIAA